VIGQFLELYRGLISSGCNEFLLVLNKCHINLLAENIENCDSSQRMQSIKGLNFAEQTRYMRDTLLQLRHFFQNGIRNKAPKTGVEIVTAVL